MRENGKLIRPGTFLPAAERHGMIHEVDSWVIMNVLDLLETYAIPEHENARYTMININLSGVSMGDAEILNYLVRRLKATPKLAKLLCFEITETAAISSIESCRTFMDTLTNLGCRFALDDFGNGFSSFSYLKNLPVHYLKIDGSFIQNMVHDTVDRTLVNSIYRTAEELNIETIAEFIENKETYQLLKKMGLKLGQGYFFDKPHPFKPALLRAFPTRLSCVG
jgi:EAL domain-containing protein (putative c-di-GMP-specific phosphodiesterase class I)